MKFTDKDLKQLRDGQMSVATLQTKIVGLIARLEAAEERIRTTSEWLDKSLDEGLLQVARKADKVWRKAAGK